MTMLPGCCPSCGFTGQIEAFLIEPEAKRAIARVAALEPAIGKVIGPYLRLFGTGKRGVQMRRAVKLIDELVALVETGDVCRDERAGVRRPTTTTMWAAGIEHMLVAPPSGALQNHHYLRAVVFGIADSADAQAERQREESARMGRRGTQPAPGAKEDPVSVALSWTRQQMEFAGMSQAEADAYVDSIRAKTGSAPGGPR
ncbi:MAG: hypothetical protein WDA70_03805 [Lysobacteraceae bacterium]